MVWLVKDSRQLTIKNDESTSLLNTEIQESEELETYIETNNLFSFKYHPSTAIKKGDLKGKIVFSAYLTEGRTSAPPGSFALYVLRGSVLNHTSKDREGYQLLRDTTYGIDGGTIEIDNTKATVWYRANDNTYHGDIFQREIILEKGGYTYYFLDYTLPDFLDGILENFKISAS